MKKSYLLAILLIVIAIAAGYYISRLPRFDKTSTFYGYYPDARGLQASGAVTVEGVRVGKVSAVSLTADKRVKVTLSIQKKTPVPAGTIAVIESDGLTGDRSIALTMGNGQPLPEYTILKTGQDSSFVESFNAKVTPLLRTGKVLMHTADSSLREFNYIIASGWGARTQKDIRTTTRNTASLARSSAGLNRNLSTIDTTIRNLNGSLSNPVSKNADINRAITKANKSVQDFSQKDLNKSMSELRKNIQSLSASIRKGGDNRMLKDKSPYEAAAKKLDTLQTVLDDYYKDPPPIQLIGGSSKKK